MRTIARVSRLRFFSTEVVRDVRGRLLVVDYVNEICDMRLQSAHPDGVPDAVVARIANRIAAYAGGAAGARAAPAEEAAMKIRGLLMGVLLAMVAVYFIFFAKVADDKGGLEIEVDKYLQTKIKLTGVNLGKPLARGPHLRGRRARAFPRPSMR